MQSVAVCQEEDMLGVNHITFCSLATNPVHWSHKSCFSLDVTWRPPLSLSEQKVCLPCILCLICASDLNVSQIPTTSLFTWSCMQRQCRFPSCDFLIWLIYWMISRTWTYFIILAELIFRQIIILLSFSPPRLKNTDAHHPRLSERFNVWVTSVPQRSATCVDLFIYSRTVFSGSARCHWFQWPFGFLHVMCGWNIILKEKCDICGNIIICFESYSQRLRRSITPKASS